MTDPTTPLTAESEALLAEVHGTQMALTVFPARLRAIEAAAARRAIEGSGVVEDAREAASAMPADACPACGAGRDTGLITHADWCPLFRLYRALAALHHPEKPRVERCAVCGVGRWVTAHDPEAGPSYHPFTPEAR